MEQGSGSQFGFFAHPTIRLASVLAFVVFVPQFGVWTLSVSSLALLVQRAVAGREAFRTAVTAVWRLRWLLIAIAVLYFGFTPGQPVFAFSDLPSQQGLAEGTRRVLVLVLILLVVQAMLQALGPRQLAAALVQLAAPLAMLGAPVERFAVRLAAALDAVQTVGERARQARHDTAGGSLLQRAAQLIVDIERAAGDAAGQLGAVPTLHAPVWWSWLMPLMIGVAAFSAARWSL